MTIDFDAFFHDFGSRKGVGNHYNCVFLHFWGVRFRGCILEGILDDLCMRKPSKTIHKSLVLKLSRLFEKVLKSIHKSSQKKLGNY